MTEISARTFTALMTAGLALPWLLLQVWLYMRESKRRTWSVLGWDRLWILIAVIIPGYALGVFIARRRRKQEHNDAIARTARNQVR